MLLEISMIILGFALLISGANLLVKGSSNIAKKFHIPEILIGLTIVALGTSAPELIISITSGNRGATDLIVGNAIGSNLCNLLLILGLIATIKPIKIDKETKNIHIPVLFLATLSILIMGLELFGSGPSVINKIEGIILIIMFILYFSYPIIVEIKDIAKSFKENKKNNQFEKNNIFLSIIYIIIGIILLKYGGDFVVDYSTKIAQMFNVSQRIIGLTIVAFGTSLPELVTSMLAIIRKDTDLAVGNLVGSSVLNIFLILGTGAIITPLLVTNEFKQNILLLLLSTVLLWLFNFIGKKDTITKGKGIMLILIFLAYLIKLFI